MIDESKDQSIVRIRFGHLVHLPQSLDESCARLGTESKIFSYQHSGTVLVGLGQGVTRLNCELHVHHTLKSAFVEGILEHSGDLKETLNSNLTFQPNSRVFTSPPTSTIIPPLLLWRRATVNNSTPSRATFRLLSHVMSIHRCVSC